MTETLTTALERSAQPKGVKSIYDVLEREKPNLTKRLPSGIEWDWFEGTIRNELRRTPKLLECDPMSLAAAVVQCVSLGLSPGPLGHAALVPFKHEVVFIIMYKGLVHLAYSSGLVKDVATGIVFEGDAFEWREGTRPFLDHTPTGPPGERDWTHAYAVARLKTGGTVFRVIFPEDVDKAKARSQNATSPYSPWTTDLFAMIRKTAVRRLSSMLPQSPVFARALEADEVPIEAVSVEEAMTE